MINEKNGKEVNKEEPEKDVAIEVNLNLNMCLPEFFGRMRIANTVELFANCDFRLTEDKEGFRTKKEYLEYLAECGSAECGNTIIAKNKNNGG